MYDLNMLLRDLEIVEENLKHIDGMASEAIIQLCKRRQVIVNKLITIRDELNILLIGERKM